MTNLLRHAMLSYKGLFDWLNWPAYISNAVLRPILLLTLFTIVGRYALDPLAAQAQLIGMSVYGLGLIVTALSKTFAIDVEGGTLAVTVSSNANRLMLYANRAVLHIPNGFLALVSSLIFAAVFLDLDASRMRWEPLFLLTVAMTLATAAFAMFVGVAVMLDRDWTSTYWFALGLLLGLTGVVIPPDSLPTVLRVAGHGLPLTHGLAGFREAFDGAALSSVYPDMLRELAVAAAYLVVGFLCFQWVVERARRTGSFEKTRF